jgi:hypothetical protein
MGGEIGKVCEQHKVPFLDAGSVIKSSAIDGIHWDEESHQALGLAVAEAIQRLFPPLPGSGDEKV